MSWKPGRTTRRVGIAVALCVLVALAAVTMIRFRGAGELERVAARFEETVGPLDFASYAVPAVSETDDAARPILAAIESLERAEPTDPAAPAGGALQRLRSLNRLAGAGWGPEQWHTAREAVAAHRQEIALLHEAAGRPASSFGLDYAAGPEMEIPNLLAALHAGDLLFAEARLAWAAGDTGRAVAAVEALGALSGTLQREAPLIFQLVGHSVELLQHRAIREGLATGGLSGADIRRLRASVAPRPRDERLARTLGAEGAFLYTARPGGWIDRELTPERTLGERWGAWMEGDASVARGLGYYEGLARELPRVSFAEARSRPDLLEPPAGDSTSIVSDLSPTLYSYPATEALARLSRLSLDLAAVAVSTGSLPTALPATPEAAPGPFTGQRPTVESVPDGSVVVSIPGAEELWREVVPREIAPDEEELFTWRIRPPSEVADEVLPDQVSDAP